MRDITQFLDGNVFGAMAMDIILCGPLSAAQKQAIQARNQQWKLMLSKAFPAAVQNAQPIEHASHEFYAEQGNALVPSAMGGE